MLSALPRQVRRRLLRPLLFCQLALLPFGAQAEEISPLAAEGMAQVQDWLVAVGEAYRGQQHCGLMATRSLGEPLRVYRTVRKGDIHYIEAMDGGASWMSDGERSHCQIHAELGGTARACPDRVLWLPKTGQPLKGYRLWRAAAPRKVADRPAHCVYFQPVDHFRHTYQLCADSETHFPLRVASLGPRGEELAWTEFSSVRFHLDSEPAGHGFQPDISTQTPAPEEYLRHAAATPREIAPAAERRHALAPSWLPEGFRLRRTHPHLMYSDGIAAFSIVLDNAAPPGEVLEQVESGAQQVEAQRVRVEDVRRMGRINLWAGPGADGQRIAVVGELSPHGVLRVLRSIRQVSEPARTETEME